MKIVEEVMKEVEKATAKFPTWPTDPLHALAVLGEEYGELTKAVLQFTYEPHKSTLDDIREEAVQTAAMSIRFAMSLGKYDYNKAEQHKQSSEGDRFLGMTVEEIQAQMVAEDTGVRPKKKKRKCHYKGCQQPEVGGPCALCYD